MSHLLTLAAVDKTSRIPHLTPTPTWLTTEDMHAQASNGSKECRVHEPKGEWHIAATADWYARKSCACMPDGHTQVACMHARRTFSILSKSHVRMSSTRRHTLVASYVCALAALGASRQPGESEIHRQVPCECPNAQAQQERTFGPNMVEMQRAKDPKGTSDHDRPRRAPSPRQDAENTLIPPTEPVSNWKLPPLFAVLSPYACHLPPPTPHAN